MNPAGVNTMEHAADHLFAGPAGAGKSTLARAWCQRRRAAVAIDFDKVRELIVSGRADPQEPGQRQAAQYVTSARAAAALAHAFSRDGYDVTIDDVFYPGDFTDIWRPLLRGLPWKMVVIRPSLRVTLERGAARGKFVRPDLVHEQHSVSGQWPSQVIVDTTKLSAVESLTEIDRVLARQDFATTAPTANG